MVRRACSRRDVLEGTVGLAALTSLTGCLQDGERNRVGTGTADDGSAVSEDGTAADNATVTAGGSGEFSVTDWVPAPSLVPSESGYGFGVLRPAALTDDADALGRSYYDELVAVQGVLELAGIEPGSVTEHVASMSGSAISVAFDADAVASALADGGYESAGSHGGFDLWTPTEAADQSGLAVGIGAGVLVVGRARGDMDARSAATTLVDAGAGEAKRHVETTDGAAEIADRIAGADLATAITREPPTETTAKYGQFAGNTAFGYGLAVDGAQTTLSIYHVFATAEDVDVEAVRDWVDSAGVGSPVTALEGRTVEADGSATVVSGTLPTERLSETTLAGTFAASGDEVESNVQAGASVQVDEDAATITVTWTSNQNADSLDVTFAPSSGDAVQRTLQSVGEATTYEGSDGESVQVTVRGVGGDSSTVILQKTAQL